MGKLSALRAECPSRRVVPRVCLRFDPAPRLAVVKTFDRRARPKDRSTTASIGRLPFLESDTRRERMPQRRHFTLLIMAAAIALAAGCTGAMSGAGRSSTEVMEASASARPTLAGTWRGYLYDRAPQSRVAKGDATFEVRDDQTFTARTEGQAGGWSGTVIDKGNRVVFRSPAVGEMTLVRSGNTLYGVTLDPATAASVAVRLDKIEDAQSTASGALEAKARKVCEAVGGAYSAGTCHSASDVREVQLRCEARGGVYFDGGNYCEVAGPTRWRP